MLISKLKFQKKSVHLYTRVNRFVCNFLDMVHSRNPVLRSGGGGESGVYFFVEDICDVVFSLFDTKIKQHVISTDRESIPSLK